MTDAPQVFISYSHDSPKHKQWVSELAAKLRDNGVNTILDQWDLSPGDDVTLFMDDGLLKSEAQDIAGNLKISPLGRTISHKFVENTKAGKIFVIVGQVRNEYDHPRSNIKITGKIYRNGKALVKSATVYCGNMLSDADLERMDIKAIGKRLQNRFGDNRSNIKVKTGKTIPFVIVFNKLPANLDEYTVEVAGSSS